MATPTQQIIKKAKSFGSLDSNISVPTQGTTQGVTQSVSSPDYTKVNNTGVTKGQPLDTGLVGVTPKAETTPVQTVDQTNQDQAKSIFANKYKNQGVMTDEANTALNAGLTTPEPEKTLEQKAQDARNAAQDAQLQSDLLGASKIVSQAEQQKQYATGQEGIRKQIEDLNIQNAEVASSQRIQQAQQQVNNLKQNIAYIGQGGRPSKSMVAMDAVANQISTADKTFRELVQVEDNLKTIQKLGVEYNAKAFEQKMVELQNRLDDQVNSTLQSTISSFLNESGEIDTMDELVALKEKWLDATDNSIEGLTNRNLQERQRIMDEYDTLIKEKKDVIKNTNTVNKEMSSAMGYYVDGNGNPLVTATGATIPHAKDAPIEPIFDKETGKMITFSLDEKGQIVSKIDQVIPQEVFSAETISNIIQSVKNGTLTPEQAVALVPKSGRESLLQQMGSIVLPKENKAPNIEKIGVDAEGNDIYGYYDTNTQSVVPVSGGSMGGVTGDLRYLASQYPGQAWAKNNNPGGMTWGVSQGLKDAWTAAGIDFGQGTPRPANEGNSYISFNTIEDGLAAQWIALSRGGGDINARLQKWVGTGEGPNYAKQVMGFAGIPNGTKFTDLTDEQAQALQMAVIKKESPGLYKLLNQSPKAEDNPVIDTLLGSGKFTKDQAAAMKKAINSGEDPNTVIKNQAKQILGTEGKTLTQYETTLYSMNALKDALNQFYKEGGDTGILKGNFEKVVNKLGKVDDPKLKSLAVQVQSALQIYRNAISGTAYSEQEGKDIADIFPGINKSKSLNDSIFAGRNAAIQSVIDGMYTQAIGDKAYSQIKGGTKQSQTPQQSNIPAALANPGVVQGGSVNDPLGLR